MRRVVLLSTKRDRIADSEKSLEQVHFKEFRTFLWSVNRIGVIANRRVTIGSKNYLSGVLFPTPHPLLG